MRKILTVRTKAFDDGNPPAMLKPVHEEGSLDVIEGF